MRQLLETTLTQGVLPQFNGVYITDCTRLVWSACGLKLAVQWEIQRGRLQANLMPLTQHDQKAPLIDQALHLGDLGFFKLQRFRTGSENGVFWLTRYKIGTGLFHPDGSPIDLKTLLMGAGPLNLSVRVGRGRLALTAQLHAARLSNAALATRQARHKEQARRKQRPLSQRQLDLMGWTLYLTNIPRLTFDQAQCLAS